jgi:hypothetical protein
MRKTIRLLATTLLLALTVYASPFKAAQQASTNAKSAATAQAQGNGHSANASLDAGAQIEAEMASSLDLRIAKPGDSFKMKTVRPVKRDGRETISRGSIITGHVEQVTRADNQTTARLVFDAIEDKKTHATAPLSATISAVSAATSRVASAGSDEMMPPLSRQSAPRQQSGGLLGGVTNTVGGVTGGVTGAVSDVTGSVGATADAATRTTLGANGLGRGAIQIVSDTATAAAATSGSERSRSPLSFVSK